MKYLIVLFLTVFISCNQPNSNDKLKVVGIKDGDTIVLLNGEESQTIRLADIDCPEKNQPFGKAAKQFASDLCFGRYVKLITDGKKDRWKRTIGTIIIDDTINLNKELVKAGLAWHYKKYSKNEEYAQLETQAKENGMGLWSDDNPIPPSEWRSKK